MIKVIYYFTGTGNSLKIAKDLAENLKDVILKPIASYIKKDKIVEEADIVGLIFPVYFFGTPNIVIEFIKKLELKDNCYLFALPNCAGTPGMVFNQLEKLFSKKNIKISYGKILKMPGNYIIFYGAPSKEKQEKYFNTTNVMLKEIAQDINNKIENNIPKFNIPIIKQFFELIFYLGSTKTSEMAKKFWVNEKCNHCNICQKVCPVDNIVIENNKIIWKEKCEQCLACLQWCPQNAIEITKRSIGKNRYHHKDIKLNEIIAQKNLD